MALYNDRVYAFERMKAIDPVLDTATPEQLAAFIADDDRNHLAFMELTYFEKTGEFLCVHPILQHQEKQNELEVLRKTNPAEFTRQMVNAQKSTERYLSRIKQQKYKNDQELADWTRLIESYTQKLNMMQQLISK